MLPSTPMRPASAFALARKSGHLELEILDDGRGGADIAAGSGLRGLADRVEAIGGSLAVEARLSGGTRLVAVLPLIGAPEPAAGPS